MKGPHPPDAQAQDLTPLRIIVRSGEPIDETLRESSESFYVAECCFRSRMTTAGGMSGRLAQAKALFAPVPTGNAGSSNPSTTNPAENALAKSVCSERW